MNPRSLRVRRAIDNNLVLVLSVCLVAVLVGGYLTYSTHVEPGVKTERSEESSWSSTVDLTHGATVTGNTSVFSEGMVLRDRSTYLVSVMPVANGSFQYTYRATENGELDIDLKQTVVLRSVEERDGAELEYWRTEEPLANGSVSDVSPGETVRFPVSLDVAEQMAAVDDIEQELGGTPGSVELLMISEFVISGELNGERITESYRYETGVQVQDNVYQFEGTGPYEETGQQFTEREVEAAYGPLRSTAGPVLTALGVLGGLAVVLGRYRGTLSVSQAEREWLAYRATYQEYEGWISTGHVADTALPSSRVTLDSLNGLVDVAIDSNRRVIHDKRRSRHLVVVDETAYTYNPPPTPSGNAPSLVTSGETTQQLTPADNAGGSTVGDGSSHTETDASERSDAETASTDGAAQQDSGADTPQPTSGSETSNGNE
ncbi:MAG: hypothetical protein J07HX64_03022 [halophilic archaeon J07HX64]|nr:MAG: hypothetical protein J07HX64_03022 [halophilic archaeon J07HX64]